jgi:TolB protein
MTSRSKSLAFLPLALVCLTGASKSDQAIEAVGNVELFASGIASTKYSEIRLTISPDGKKAAWFSRDRPGGAGGYDIWISRMTPKGWSAAEPAPFNTSTRDFDPAFSSDGRFIYFCSDRAGGSGGDDIYRVPMLTDGFGKAQNLGPSVNSAGDEFSPMLSKDLRRLLFSSNRAGGAGGHDLYVAKATKEGFNLATRVAGQLNTPANEFDATFLADDRTIVFARVPDFSDGRIDLFVSRSAARGYEVGATLPSPVNDGVHNSYGAMIDWSTPDRLLFSARRNDAQGMDLYTVRYRTHLRTKRKDSL